MKTRASIWLGVAALLLPWGACAEAPRFTLGNSSFQTVMEFVKAARFHLEVEMYDLTDRKILSALKKAAHDGVDIRIILDPSQRRNLLVPQRLKNPRIQVRWMDTDQQDGQLLHAKVACEDSGSLLIGSANWTYTGLNISHEAVLVIEDPSLALDFSTAFEQDWSQAKAQWPRHRLQDEELKALPNPDQYYESNPRFRKRRQGP